MIKTAMTLTAGFLLLFTASVYAATEVTLTILSPADGNGNFTVFDGSKLKVRYTVDEDEPRSLNKSDKIQLVRVSDDNVVLLKTNMGASHGGASGRYGRLRETAFQYAFIIDRVTIR